MNVLWYGSVRQTLMDWLRVASLPAWITINFRRLLNKHMSMNGMGNEEKEGGGKRVPRGAVSLVRAIFIGAGMALAWGLVSRVLNLESRFPDAAVRQMFAQPLAVQIALYGIASPVLEEFLFRKLLFDLAVRILPERFAAVIVSALFALWHGSVIQMLYAFPAGLILQELRLRSARMEEPVLCHAGANMTAILVSYMP